MRTKLLFTIVLAMILSVCARQVSAISLTQSIDKTEMPFEDSAKFEITVEWPGSQFAYRFINPLNPYIDRLKISRFTSSISSFGTGKDEKTTKKFTYVLVPTSGGEGKIDPITINFITWPDSISGELITEPVAMTISEQIIKPKAGEFPAWISIMGGLLLVGSGATIYFLRAKAIKGRPIVKTPSESALDELSKLKAACGSDLKRFQTGVFNILSNFLRSKHNINLSGLSEEKIGELLSKTDLSEPAQASIRNWLVQAEKDKYRPVEAAPGETVRLETELRRFFENVK